MQPFMFIASFRSRTAGGVRNVLYSSLAPFCFPVLLVSFFVSADIAADSTNIGVNVRLLHSFKAPCHVTTQPAWHPNNREVAIGCNLHKTITVLDVHTGKVLRTIDADNGGVSVLAYSQNGKYLAIGHSFVGNNALNLYDVENKNILHKFSPPAAEGSGHRWGSPSTLAFSPDSQYLITGGSRTPASLYAVITGNHVKTLFSPVMRPHGSKKGFNSITAISYSPDSQWIAIGYVDGTLELWATKTWSVVQRLSTINRAVSGLSFTSNGKYLAVGVASRIVHLKKEHGSERLVPEDKSLPEGGDIFILETPQLRLNQPLNANSKTTYAPIAFTNDGRYLISSGGEIKILDVIGRSIKKISFTNTWHYQALSPDNQKIAISSKDEVRIYQLIQ